MATTTAKKVAEYFLSLMEEDSGDTISNLKLQKLVYYAQGFHLAIFGKPLFDDPIVKWVHGPVVVDLYHAYKEYGAGAIPKPTKCSFTHIPKKTKSLLNDIWTIFGQFSGWKLRNMTHAEAPWQNARINGRISQKAMKEYFVTQLEDDDE